MTFYQRIRMRHGLRWNGLLPENFWRDVLSLLLLMGVIVLGGWISDRLEMGARLEEEKAHRMSYEKALIGCMNGKGFYYPESKAAFLCEATRI